MPLVWNLDEVNRHCTDQIEESLTLDYKAADACSREGRKPEEMTVAVSAMANSAGGTIIYGLREYQDDARRHRIERLDPIDGSLYTKEWLEDIIGHIRPHIDGLIIHPVRPDPSTAQVIYVVEIPQGNTAHQAADRRYYRRHNFKSEPMDDHEIRDVMNRATRTAAKVTFGSTRLPRSEPERFRLTVIVENVGPKVIHNFKLRFTFPAVQYSYNTNLKYDNNPRIIADITPETEGRSTIACSSLYPILPEDSLPLTDLLRFDFELSEEQQAILMKKQSDWGLDWKLFADDMVAKSGHVRLVPDIVTPFV